MPKIELYHDNFQNFKRYNIPKAQLVIADIPYNIGADAYASNPMWYQGGDNKNGDRKLPPLRAFISQHKDAVWYLGIASDEPKRLASMEPGAVSLLAKYGVDQDRAREMCRKVGLLSPIYEFAPRGGCFFCPNAKEAELRHLRDHHPDLWAKLLGMAADPRTARRQTGFELGLLEHENNFDFDDRQISMEDLLEEDT